MNPRRSALLPAANLAKYFSAPFHVIVLLESIALHLWLKHINTTQAGCDNCDDCDDYDVDEDYNDCDGCDVFNDCDGCDGCDVDED